MTVELNVMFQSVAKVQKSSKVKVSLLSYNFETLLESSNMHTTLKEGPQQDIKLGKKNYVHQEKKKSLYRFNFGLDTQEREGRKRTLTNC